jgi:hypothetical protein
LAHGARGFRSTGLFKGVAVPFSMEASLHENRKQEIMNPLYGIYLASGKDIVLQGNTMESAPVGTKGLVGIGP